MKVATLLIFATLAIASEVSARQGAVTKLAIGVNTTVKGELGLGDEQLSGRYLDAYYFDGVKDQAVTIQVNSDLDLVVSLFYFQADASTHVAADDDSGGRFNPRLSLKLPQDGTYVIQVFTYGESEVGGYELSLRPAVPNTSTDSNRWIRAGKNSTPRYIGSIDQLSIVRSVLEMPVAWIRIEFAQIMTESWGRYDSLLNLTEFDCVRRQFRLLRVIYRSGTQQVHSIDQTSAWRSVIPETMVESEMAVACGPR